MKKLIFFLILLCSSGFFILKANAATLESGTNIYLTYDKEFVKKTLENKNLLKIYNKFVSTYGSSIKNSFSYVKTDYWFDNFAHHYDTAYFSLALETVSDTDKRLVLMLYNKSSITSTSPSSISTVMYEGNLSNGSLNGGYGYGYIKSKILATSTLAYDDEYKAQYGNNIYFDKFFPEIFFYDTLNKPIIFYNNDLNYYDEKGNPITEVPKAVDINSNVNLENKSSISNNKNLYSYDVYLDNTDLNNFNFKIDLKDKNNYNELNISKTRINGFQFYGLKFENGLYHWEKIQDVNNYYVDYNDEDYIINDSDFSFQGKAYFNFANYQKIKLSIQFTNAINYDINYSDDLVSAEYDYNYFDSDYCYVTNNFKNKKYILFSTSDDIINGFVYTKAPKDNNTVWIDYFNTEKHKFEVFTNSNLLYTIDSYAYNSNYLQGIGKTNKLGFYVTNNTKDDYNYFVYVDVKMNLYYSYNSDENMENSVFIDSEGNIINSDVNTYYHENNISDVLSDFKRYIQSFNDLVGYFFSKLNPTIRNTIIAVFSILMTYVLIKWFRR